MTELELLGPRAHGEACGTAVLKATAATVPAGEQVFFRSLFAIPVILAWLAWRGELATGLKTRDPMAHAYRHVRVPLRGRPVA